MNLLKIELRFGLAGGAIFSSCPNSCKVLGAFVDMMVVGATFSSSWITTAAVIGGGVCG